MDWKNVSFLFSFFFLEEARRTYRQLLQERMMTCLKIWLWSHGELYTFVQCPDGEKTSLGWRVVGARGDVEDRI